MTTESQNKRILKHLESGKSITPLQALKLFGCFRLGARIFNLRARGHAIETTRIRVGDGKYVAKYHLRKASK